MCFICPEKEYPHVAFEDIPVFKVVLDINNEICSAYQRFKYKIGETYKYRGFPIINPPKRIIESGVFHSYDPCCVKVKKHDTRINVTFRNNFIFCKLDVFNEIERYAVMHCIIPKNSLYIINAHGEVVSNSIKVINIEKI